jgi:hypothetical protein
VNQVLDLGLPDLPHGDRLFLSSRYHELKSSPVAADVRRLTSKRELFAQRCRILATLDKGRPQIEAMIADAIQRGEPNEVIAHKVRAYFNHIPKHAEA